MAGGASLLATSEVLLLSHFLPVHIEQLLPCPDRDLPLLGAYGAASTWHCSMPRTPPACHHNQVSFIYYVSAFPVTSGALLQG